jgi:hypothetical protein
MGDKQKDKKFGFAQKTLEHLNERLRNPYNVGSYGQYLKLKTATFIDNKKTSIVPMGLYGGGGQELRHIPTPYLNNTLPKLYEFWRTFSHSEPGLPLFIIGHSFDEVFERKIRLLTPCIPNIRMLQYINVHRFFCFRTSIEERKTKIKKEYKELLTHRKTIKDERHDFIPAMHNYLSMGGELGGKKYEILDWEVQAGEGTKRAEKIDFLAVERSKKWLTVIELKFADLEDIRLKGSIFQGMDYCNWVEKHKYELAMIYSDLKINTRHRTRLILINGPKGFPDYYSEIIKSFRSRDKYQEIELYSLNNASLRINLMRIYPLR